jgi:hypothetical protein
VVTLSSNDTEEALGLLSLSPTCDLTSQPSKGVVQEPTSSSSSDLFEDWPEANNMAASVYVTLTTEASSSLASAADAPHGRRKCHTGSSSVQSSRSHMVLS